MTATRSTLALLLALGIAAQAPAATTEELEVKLQALAVQMQALQAEITALKAQNAANANAGAVPAASSTTVAASLPPAVAAEHGVDWFGYGEINYWRPDASTDTRADVGRFVLGAAYRFDDRTRMVSELEIEHAVASSDDSGEVEVEQAYIERQLGDSTYAKFGLFLIPSGMLNESHEPTRYYGVFRNAVETAIIPTTWREGGFAVQGNTDGGLRWDLGISTGFNLSKWDPTSSEEIGRAHV